MTLQKTSIDRWIGVISDTHGLLRPEALDALKGVELILHAGDVGNPQILETLATIAPTVAVRGNIDQGAWAKTLAVHEIVDIAEVSIYMLHDLEQLDVSLVTERCKVVISGHSHKPHVEERKGILYLNPGSAGPRRFSLPISLAKLRVRGTTVTAHLIELM